MGNSGCFLWGKPAAADLRYPTYDACWVYKCFLNLANSDMDDRIFNVRTDVNACNCTRGCTDTGKRVCTESWLWEQNLPHRGIELASAACRSDILPTELLCGTSLANRLGKLSLDTEYESKGTSLKQTPSFVFLFQTLVPLNVTSSANKTFFFLI